MSDAKCKASCTIEGYQEEDEDEDMGDEDRVERSIQQILAGMTNEFNKTIKVEPAPEKLAPVDPQEQSPAVEVRNEEPPENGTCTDNGAQEKMETAEAAPEESVGEAKKDGNIPRIVLTFRAIDENTDHGKKTKISSCSSNLSLVPDELANCDQIGGVSVKIESSDDNVENRKKNEDCEKGDSGGEKKEDVSEEMMKVEKVEKDDRVEDEKNESLAEKSESFEEAKVSGNGEPVVRKKRVRRSRLRSSSELTEERLGPKRSARRLCKEQLRSTVLESAIARKEKSNYTVENHRKQRAGSNRPGRPKKIKTSKDDAYHGMNSQVELNLTHDTFKNDCASDSMEDSGTHNQTQHYIDIEMPKLSPIDKTPDLPSSKMLNRSLGSPLCDENPALEDEKPFLKPIVTKRGRDRGRRRGNLNARKSHMSYHPEIDGSFVEPKKFSSLPEERPSVPKRSRRSSTPSPSPAEGQASKPESTAIMTNDYRSMVCMCQVQSSMSVTVNGYGAPLYCTAMESIDEKVIGCCNVVDSNDVIMRRPSTRIPFLILCRMHRERLDRHNCCPSCGLFCAQGRFVQCKNGHQYHRECAIFNHRRNSCPHCSCETDSYEVIITMTGFRRPVYIPTRRKFSKLPSAKMSLPAKGSVAKAMEKRSLSPLIDPELMKIPRVTANSEKPERYTMISLYSAVKNGDLEKLVNILACGYNANHVYQDYANRTCLHLAAEKGNLACVHVLVQAGAQLDVMEKRQFTPLMLAAKKGQANVVSYLLRVNAEVMLKAEDGMTALHMAAKEGHLDVCRVLLAESKFPKLLTDAVDEGGWTSLIWACEFKHVEVVRFLLENRSDPLMRDSEQNIALHWSAFSGSSEITEMLLNYGSDVNAVNIHGDTPLIIAARQDEYPVTVLLLAWGARVHEVNASREKAINCCTPEGDTASALRLNARINKLAIPKLEKTERILTNDISRGKEKDPIQCINVHDDDEKPTDFVYITENCFTSSINIDRTITSLRSCRCEDNCRSDNCACGHSSFRCWYDKEGKLVPEFNYMDPPMLFECNAACDCHQVLCMNRVVQRGLTQRFQLFRTPSKGWGVKTLRTIPKGVYVCEYVGEIISDSEADHREDDSYLFDLDNHDGETYCIDARRYGNIARFINHSCAPNLLPVRVYIEHQDIHFPRIAFFANDDIEAGEELSFDYGEKFWIIKAQSFTCACGAEHCRYSERTITATLDNYRHKLQQEEAMSAQ